MIGTDSIHTAAASGKTPPQISGADDQSDFNALIQNFADPFNNDHDGIGLISMLLVSFESFAAELEKNAVVTELTHFFTPYIKNVILINFNCLSI